MGRLVVTKSPGSGPALNVTAAAHSGSGHTVVSAVNAPLPFESRHEEAGERPLSSLCLLDSPRKYLLSPPCSASSTCVFYRGLLFLFLEHGETQTM